MAARVRTGTFAKGGAGFKRIRAVAGGRSPDAEVLQMDAGGHFPQLEAPEERVAALGRRLEG